VRQTRKLIVIDKESYHFTVPRSGFLINPFRFISNIAQGLGGLCIVWPTAGPPDHRSGGPRTISQADQGPSVRRTKDHRSGGPSFMKTTDRTHDLSVGRPDQNLDQ